MSRRHIRTIGASIRRVVIAACVAASSIALVSTTLSDAASASPVSPASPSWCRAFGASIAVWTKTSPNLPICGPGPDYGGTWRIVDLPDPGGELAGYLNGTPGFQCVELAERYLDVKYGFAPINAEGSSVALNYHDTYPRTTLTVNGSKGAIGHAPVRGDVVSFALSSSFDGYSDGHVALVVSSHVDRRTGNGTVVVAQENVSSVDYIYTLNVANWRLHDPREPSDAEFQFPYAEWLHVRPLGDSHRPSPLVKQPVHKKKRSPLLAL